MRTLYSTVFVIGLGVLFSACSGTKVRRESALHEIPIDASGALWAIRLESDLPAVADHGCSLVLRDASGFRKLDIAILPGEQTIFVELPPGEYRVENLVCSTQREWPLLSYPWVPFRVESKRITLLPPWIFSISGDLKITLERGNREYTLSSLRAAYGRLTSDSRARLISGYTARVVPAAQFEAFSLRGEESVTRLDGKKTVDSDALWPDLGPCYDGEELVNSLWLGRIQATATYYPRRKPELRFGTEPHSFTDPFVRCVEAALRGHHPPLSAGAIELHLSL